MNIVNPPPTFKLMEDSLAEAIISYSQTLAQHQVDSKINPNHLVVKKQKETRELIKALSKFDNFEKQALSAKIDKPDPKKTLAYIPRDILKNLSI